LVQPEAAETTHNFKFWLRTVKNFTAVLRNHRNEG